MRKMARAFYVTFIYVHLLLRSRLFLNKPFSLPGGHRLNVALCPRTRGTTNWRTRLKEVSRGTVLCGNSAS